MGAAKRRQREFLRANPICAFCGGRAAATTIEHCPPRALFQRKEWPEGFEFPSCRTCNQDSSDNDLLVAMLARLDPFQNKGDRDGRLNGLMAMTNRQFPGLFQKMMPSATEARRHNRELGLRPESGKTHQETGAVKVTEELHQAVGSIGRKLAKGIFYQETGYPFPDFGCLVLNWFSNTDLFRNGKYVVFDLLQGLGGEAPPLKRGRKYLNDQFEYKLSMSPDKDIFVLQALFGNVFGFVVFGSTLPGKLEAIIKRLREQTQRDDPFSVLQSTSLT